MPDPSLDWAGWSRPWTFLRMGFGDLGMELNRPWSFGDLIVSLAHLPRAPVWTQPLALSTAKMLRRCCILMLSGCTSGLAVREFPILNSTTSAPSNVPSQTTRTEDPFFKPHVENSENGFGQPTTRDFRNIRPSSSAPGDVGSIIASLIGLPSIRVESTATGWMNNPGILEPTPTDTNWWPTGAGDTHRPHIENSAPGWHAGDPVTDTEPVVTPPPAMPPTVTYRSWTLRPVPATSVVIGDHTLNPGGETATIGQGDSMTKVFLDSDGLPVVVIGEQTSTHELPHPSTVIRGQTLSYGGTPITIGKGWQQSTISINEAGETVIAAEGATSTLQGPPSQPFTIGEITATAQASNYQYVFDSSTLGLGHPVTVNDVAYSLSTDSSGATILIAGDSTTTLLGAPQLLQISTIVISGTTEYIMGSQTLAPGHAITIDGTTISLTTSAGATELVVGDMTTTIRGRPETRVSAGLTTEVATATRSDASPSATASKGAADGNMKMSYELSLGVLSLMIASLGLG